MFRGWSRSKGAQTMYDELIQRLHRCAVHLPEKFSKNAELLDVLMKAADAIEELSVVVRAQKAVLDKLPKWIPVTERLPDTIHEYVLCCGEKGVQFVGWIGEGVIVSGKARAFQHGGKGRYITHWMPLPEPPKEEVKD